MKKILVTGAMGQIGSPLVAELSRQFGEGNVIASDVRLHQDSGVQSSSGPQMPCALLDCTDANQLNRFVHRYDIGTIYHLGALLSAVAEEKPQSAWRVNVDGLINVLEVARHDQCQVFFPSSIGAFGPETPRELTPQVTIQRPTAMYGVTKVTGEILCDYYWLRFGVDTRGLRLPGLISADTMPGGGTTDYAVHIFHEAVRRGRYTCFLRPDTRLDMMYMPDAVRAIVELMQADPHRLKHRNAYNLSALNVTPADLAGAIQEHLPDFSIDYRIDPVRQRIADSWPERVDDSAACKEWGWHPRYSLALTVSEMLKHIQQQNQAPLRLAM